MSKYTHEIGVVGNVFVRQNVLVGKGTTTQRHKHHHDHMTLLTTGSVCVSVDGCTPKVFTAPTYIVIKAERSHHFECLTEDAVWYCVFALRDEDGGQTDLYDGRNSPYGTFSDGYTSTKVDALEAEITLHAEEYGSNIEGTSRPSQVGDTVDDGANPAGLG